MSAAVTALEFNDPGCPFGYSGEVNRRRIEWIYGEQLELTLRLVGLQSNPDGLLKLGFTPERMTEAWRGLADQHGMPFNFTPPERHSATVPACRAIVAAREHGANARRLMRWFRIKRFSGEAIDTPEAIDSVAVAAGIDPGDLRGWSADDITEEELAADFKAARSPVPEALAVDHRLADWEGGRRYTCPSWEVTRVSDGRTIALPGFQPYEVYEVAMANMVASAEQRAPASDAAAVLEWAGEPLATREVATVMQLGDDEAAEKLAATGAREIALESSSFWVAA